MVVMKYFFKDKDKLIIWCFYYELLLKLNYKFMLKKLCVVVVNNDRINR